MPAATSTDTTITSYTSTSSTSSSSKGADIPTDTNTRAVGQLPALCNLLLLQQHAVLLISSCRHPRCQHKVRQ
jgi:hypothetical protein